MVPYGQMATERTLYSFIGTQIALRRKSKRLTQARLAEVVGLSRASIANIERGRQNFLVHTLWEIGRALGAHPRDLLPKPEADIGQIARAAKLNTYSRLPQKDQEFVGAVLQEALLSSRRKETNDDQETGD